MYSVLCTVCLRQPLQWLHDGQQFTLEPNTKEKRRIAHSEPTNMRHESLFAPVPRKSRLLDEHVAAEHQASHLR